jgi:protein-tyrosine phosphatase
VSRGLTRTDRRLDWEGLHNARDLGGLRTADGLRLRNGALIRSENLAALTPNGQAALVAHGVRTLIDVRFPREVERDGDRYPFAEGWSGAGPRPDRRSVPFNTGGAPEGDVGIRAAFAKATTRAELNRLDIDFGRGGIAAVVSAIAAAEAGGVLVHCQAGKDRTGAVIAVILSLVGVPDEAIADDYADTAESLSLLIAEWLDATSSDPDERARLTEIATPTREAMLATLDYLRETYGGAEPYLLGAGVTAAEIAAVRVRLLEPATA